MSSLAPGLVIKYNKALTDDQLQQIIDEILKELFLAEDRWGKLGDEVDHNAWYEAVSEIRKVVSDRQVELKKSKAKKTK